MNCRVCRSFMHTTSQQSLSGHKKLICPTCHRYRVPRRMQAQIKSQSELILWAHNRGYDEALRDVAEMLRKKVTYRKGSEAI